MNPTRAIVRRLCVAIVFASQAALAAEPTLPPYASASPIDTPRLFGENVLSTPDDEFGGQFSPDGNTLWFSKSVPRFHLDTIFQSHYRDGRWSEPEIAAFSGIWHDYDPSITPDGRRLYFISDRPRADGKPRHGYDIWYLDRTDGGWGEPKNAGAPLNGEWSSHYASVAANGNLYFTSDRPGSKGYLDVWMSSFVDGHYAEPVNLGAEINGEQWANFEVYVAPDESYLIVSAYGHADTLGDCDLYVSYRRDGAWLPLQHPGAPLNSAARDYTARVSPDGRYLFFTSERGMPTDTRTAKWTYREFTTAARSVRNGLGNLYQIDLAAALPAPPR